MHRRQRRREVVGCLGGLDEPTGRAHGEDLHEAEAEPRLLGLQRAFETQVARRGFSFVEILTMCPTGWFIETPEAPDYLTSTLAPVHAPGVLKDVTA